jgi:hypothetical protein
MTGNAYQNDLKHVQVFHPPTPIDLLNERLTQENAYNIRCLSTPLVDLTLTHSKSGINYTDVTHYSSLHYLMENLEQGHNLHIEVPLL